MSEVVPVNVERFIDSFTGREIIVVGKAQEDGKEFVVWHYLAPEGDEVIEDRFTEEPKFGHRFTRPASGEVAWRVEPRTWHDGYEEDGEQIGSAFASLRTDLGFESSDEFASWIYAEGKRRHGMTENLDVPSVLIDAVEFPVLGWGETMYVIDGLAKALGVSPGTVLDEVLVRSSRHDGDGNRLED